MTAETADAPFDEVAITHTAKSKSFRYLSESRLREHVQEPDGVYYRRSKHPWLVPVERPRPDRSAHESPIQRIVLVVTVDDRTAVVVTQTGEHDHYTWDDYTEVGAVGRFPDVEQSEE